MPDIVKQWKDYFKILSPQENEVILDVGCNTGDASRLLLLKYPKIQKVIGIDKSRKRYNVAIDRFKIFPDIKNVEFYHSSGENLSFEDNTFDRAYCMEVIEWVENKEKFINEIYRVLKPKGLFLLEHTDFDTQVFNSSLKELNRRIIFEFSDIGNGQIGRELFSLCNKSKFSEVVPMIYTYINTSFSENFYPYKISQMMGEWLLNHRKISKKDFECWIKDLKEKDKVKEFYYSINRNICLCNK